jgi:hypothetical protein
MAYDYIDQSILASTVITAKNNDGFFLPTQLLHNGYAADGNLYINGVLQTTSTSQGWGDGGYGDGAYGGVDGGGLPSIASWALEPPSTFRSSIITFPTNALLLVSEAALTIIDQSQGSLDMWMIFLLADALAFTNNFGQTGGDAFGDGGFGDVGFGGAENNGWLPFSIQYSSGVITVCCSPDVGSQSSTKMMAVNLDFTQDKAYVDTPTAVEE